MTVVQLKELCKAAGIPSSGKKKAELVALLASQPTAEDADEIEEAEEEAEEEIKEEPMKEQLIKEQLRELNYDELAEILESRDLDASGSYEDLLERLADHLAPEVERELEMDDEDEDDPIGDPSPSSRSRSSQERGSERSRSRIEPLDEEEVRKLVEFRTKSLGEGYEDLSRSALYKELKQFDPNAKYSGKDELVSLLASLKAQEEVEGLMRAYEASDPEAVSLVKSWLSDSQAALDAEESAASPAPPLRVKEDPEALEREREAIRKMSPVEQRKMKATALRRVLEVLGLPTEGNRYEMLERLKMHASISQWRMLDQSQEEGLREKVQGMALREIRDQLLAVKLETSGSRTEVEERLYSHLLGNILERDEAESKPSASDAQGEEEEEEEDFVYEDVAWGRISDADLRVVRDDPDLTLALVFGAPGGTLFDADRAVRAARNVMEALQTAPLPRLVFSPNLDDDKDDEEEEHEGQEGEEVGEGEGEGEEGGQGVYGDDWRMEAKGVTVLGFYADRSGLTLHPVPPQLLLASTSAASIEAQLPSTLQASATSQLDGGDGDEEALTLTLESLGANLILPLFPPSQSTSQDSGGLPLAWIKKLRSCGIPCLGLPSLPSSSSSSSLAVQEAKADPSVIVADKALLNERLRYLGYPTLPSYHLTSQDLPSPNPNPNSNPDADKDGRDDEEADLGPVVESLARWCTSNGWDPEYKQLVVSPSNLGGGQVVVVCGVKQAAEAASAHLLGPSKGQGGSGVVVEPWLGRDEGVEFTCLVVEGPDGPLALLPTEVEIEDVDSILADSLFDRHAWSMMQEGGTDPSLIQQEVYEARSTLVPSYHFRSFDHPREYLPSQTVRYHCPPRVARKTIHHIRHAAAKLFKDLGLRHVARVKGWILPQPDWDQKYKLTDEMVPTLPDVDLNIVEKLMEEEMEILPDDPAPLSIYYDDHHLHSADLEAFDVPMRLDASLNPTLDSTIAFSSIQPFLLLDPSSTTSDGSSGRARVIGGEAMDLTDPLGLAAQQAAEVGISHSTLLRNLINQTLRQHYIDSAEAKDGSSSKEDGEVEEEEEELVELAAGPNLEVYSTAIMRPSAPDSWDLLLEINEQYEDMEARDIARMFQMEDEGEEMLELAGTMEGLMLDYTHLIPEDQEGEEGGTAPLTPDPQIDPASDPLLVYSTMEEAVIAQAEANNTKEGQRPIFPRVIEGGIGQEVLYDPFLSLQDWVSHDELEPQPLPPMTQAEIEGSHVGYEMGEGSRPPPGLVRPPPPGSAMDLKQQYPELTDDEVMRLVVGVTHLGSRIDPEGFIRVCKEGPQGASETLAYEIEAMEDQLGLFYDPDVTEEDLDEEEEEGEGEGEEGQEAAAAAALLQEETEGVVDQEPQGADAGGGGLDETSKEMLSRALSQTPMTRDYSSRQLRPQKIFVLMGGDPVRSNDSLALGKEVAGKLAMFRDLQVEPFFLAPSCLGANERKRRAALLKKRNEWLSYGQKEEDLPSHLSLHELRSMPAVEEKLEDERVWALTEASFAQNSAKSLVDSCERSLKIATTNRTALPRLEQQGLEARWDACMELEAGGVKGVGQLWGGAYDAPTPLPPRAMTLLDLAKDALDEEALVVLCIQGEVGGSFNPHPTGSIESFFSTFGVMYCGSGEEGASYCASRSSWSEGIVHLEEEGVSALPFIQVPTSYLVHTASLYDDDESKEEAGLGSRAGKEGEGAFEARRGFNEALRALYGDKACLEYDRSLRPSNQQEAEGEEEEGSRQWSFSLRPNDNGGGGKGSDCLGFARISSPSDLLVYCQALSSSDPLIPASSLPTSSPHEEIRLPLFLPDSFIVEALIETRPILLRPEVELEGGLGSEEGPVEEMVTFTALESWVDSSPAPRVDWAGPGEAGKSDVEGWLEVSFVALGMCGSMDVLGPAIAATLPTPNPDSPILEGHETRGGKTYLCNLNEPLGIKQEVVDAAVGRIERVVGSLYLSGLVQIDALMDPRGGELVLTGVNSRPNLASPSSPVYSIALNRPQDPLYPHELLRALVLSTLSEYLGEEIDALERGDGLRSSADEGEEELEEEDMTGYEDVDADDEGNLEVEVDEGEGEVVGGTGYEGGVFDEGEAEGSDYQSNWT